MKTRKSLLFWRLLWWALTVACAATITKLSLQPATVSGETSGSLTEQLLLLFSAYRALSAERQAALLAYTDVFVRAAAHVAEYAALGTFVSALCRTYPLKHRFWWSVIPAALYALFDELVQEFLSEGRAFQFVDLVKDWTGILLGFLFVWLLCRIAKAIKEHKKRTDHR